MKAIIDIGTEHLMTDYDGQVLIIKLKPEFEKQLDARSILYYFVCDFDSIIENNFQLMLDYSPTKENLEFILKL